jgi:hypothetical protein
MPTLPLAEWRDFYVMIGTASGAIVGATFIVATLAAGRESRAIGMRGFITPTAVHLASVLVGSAVLAVPTLTSLSLGILLGVGGIAGAIYSLVVATRIWNLKLDHDDRTFYVVLPILAYGAMAIAAVMTHWGAGSTLEILAVSLVALLIIGIRNAWDMTTFLVTRETKKD